VLLRKRPPLWTGVSAEEFVLGVTGYLDRTPIFNLDQNLAMRGADPADTVLGLGHNEDIVVWK
jgi:hypothetical protein